MPVRSTSAHVNRNMNSKLNATYSRGGQLCASGREPLVKGSPDPDRLASASGSVSSDELCLPPRRAEEGKGAHAIQFLHKIPTPADPLISTLPYVLLGGSLAAHRLLPAYPRSQALATHLQNQYKSHVTFPGQVLRTCCKRCQHDGA